MEIGVSFIVPKGGAIGEPPRTEGWFAEIKSSVKENLEGMYPKIEFSFHDIETLDDVSKFLEGEASSSGYLVFVLNSVGGLIRPIVQSGKPTILVNETYGGSGEYLLEYSRALEERYPVIGISTKNVAGEKALENVELLDVIGKLRNSRALFIVSPGTKQLVDGEYPLSVDLWSSIRSIKTQTGITPIFLGSEEFVEKYYRNVDEGKAENLKEKWIEEAEENEEEEIEEIKNSAKLYFALKEVADDYDADSIAVDCIVLFRNDLLKAWPCLPFMELYKDGDVVPVCEADPYSTVSLLTMKYLADLPGFINDPALDELTEEVVYYHCYAPVNFRGPSEENTEYRIMPAHLDGKHASVHTKLPTDGEITVVGLDPENKALTLHTAETVRNEHSEYACSTKLVGKTDTQALAENWRPRSGWHRVAFYGDWSEELSKLATLLGLKVVREDEREKTSGRKR